MKCAAVLLFFAIATMASAVPQPQPQPSPQVPHISADVGACWVDFKVTDAQSKPAYDAAIHVIVRYGFLSKRKTDLTVSTNYEGLARVSGLPAEVKQPLDFEITKNDVSQTISHDPAADCHARYEVKLGPAKP